MLWGLNPALVLRTAPTPITAVALLPMTDLRPFTDARAALVAGWARTAEELDHWVSRTDAPLDPAVLLGWHREPHIHPFLLEVDGAPVGYGEVWTDAEEDEAELARIIVDPKLRGRGLGRRLVGALAGEARALGFADVWMRVVPENAPAIACYRAAGFVPTDAATEASFNEGQPRAYRWMRFVG